jgi:hypothetical protein
MEQGRSYNRETGKAVEDETVAARSAVAQKRVIPVERRDLAAQAVFIKKGGRVR